MKYCFFLFLLLYCCNSASTDKADIIFYNGEIYTGLTEQMSSLLAVADGKILYVGNDERQIDHYQGDSTKVIDLEGNFAMPGFIEGHGHFIGLGNSLQNLNFLKSKSWDEIVSMVAEKATTLEAGEWIVGRGWHQEKWNETPEKNLYGYPFHHELSAVSPYNPVILFHASGHALFANEAAMKESGVSKETTDPSGGAIIRDQNGEAIGVFEETAQRIIRNAYQDYLNTQNEEQRFDTFLDAIELAENECLKKGITTFQDAGTSIQQLAYIEQLAKDGELDLRLWMMIRDDIPTLEKNINYFPKIGIGDHFFTVRAIKSSIDGALGSFGAWLLEPYNDKPGFVGQNTFAVADAYTIAQIALDHNMQYCIHAIGDRANREVLNIFEEVNGQVHNDLRWRIEHAQHLDTADIPRFAKLGVIASMQAIHCTSDAPFVEKRLGEFRAKYGSYVWRSLLDAGAIVTNGTDAPVEDVDPLASFYASLTRKRIDNGFEFYPEEVMSRMEALHAYTSANAYAAFEEELKGSLEPGKFADITVLDKNLISCSTEDILEAKVIMTIVNGEIKYKFKG